jgi:hypothetical protein
MPPELIQQVEWMVQRRRAGQRVFGPGFFSDPAWDILMELFLARLEGRAVSIEQLGFITYESVLKRWLAILEDRGLVAKERDLPALVRLTDLGRSSLRSIFETEAPPSLLPNVRPH